MLKNQDFNPFARDRAIVIITSVHFSLDEKPLKGCNVLIHLNEGNIELFLQRGFLLLLNPFQRGWRLEAKLEKFLT